MNLTQSGSSRGHRVATPAWNKWSYRFVGAGFVLLIVAMLWGTPKGPFPTAAPTTTVTSTVMVEVTVVDFTKRGSDDLMSILGTGESLDLEESYDMLFGRVLPFETATSKGLRADIHAVAPLGKHCVLAFRNGPFDTIDVVVASRYNNSLVATLSIPLHGDNIAEDIAYWHEDACANGAYVPGQRPNWTYAEVETSI